MKVEIGRRDIHYLGAFSRACSFIFCLIAMFVKHKQVSGGKGLGTHSYALLSRLRGWRSALHEFSGSKIRDPLEKLESIKLCRVLSIGGVQKILNAENNLNLP
jgi:hypothetical protein